MTKFNMAFFQLFIIKLAPIQLSDFISFENENGTSSAGKDQAVS